MKIDRIDPELAADEITTLLGFLNFHRDTLRMKTAGLTAEQLNYSHLPSTLTLGGLLKHLAMVESNWLSEDLLDEPMMPPFDTADWAADRDWEFTTAVADAPEQLHALFNESVRRSDAILQNAMYGAGLNTLSVKSSGEGDKFSLRWIVVHLIEEYARHNGHADFIRQAIDGTTGE